MKREDLIKQWMEGRLTSDELDKEIRGDKTLSDIKHIITRSATFGAPKKRTKEEAWSLLAAKIEEGKTAKVIRLNRYKYIGLAASVTLIAMIIYTMYFKPERIVAPMGQHISFILPDDERKVHLKGEAFFDIKKGGHFEVVSEYGTVVVLGTSFNVNQRGNQIEVACFTGTVEVRNNEELTIILNAGEITRATNQALSPPAKFNTEKVASWITGDFYFDSVPLEVVLAELERQFNIQVQYKSTTPRSYTGYFNNKDLDEALQLVFQPMSLDYKKDGNKIIIE
jgi:transmembrane sensor